MATQTQSMTTSEFAKAAGVSAAGISKLIRDGKLKAKKEGGKWMIPQSQLGSEVVRALKEESRAGKSKPARAREARKPERTPASKPSKPAAPVFPALEPAPVVAASEPAPEAQTAAVAPPAEKTYTIAEFAAMTYLTEKGVGEWLKIGRIKGIQIETGEWRVLDSNLQVPDISRLVRK
jgi:excisionase family DNA binding protein